MELTETARKYEIIIILDAKLTGEQKSSILQSAIDSIEKNELKVLDSQVWLEKQKFAFPIKKQHEGTYYLINVEGTGSKNKLLRDDFRLNENILRFSMTREG
jgi:ribosomal protein S6